LTWFLRSTAQDSYTIQTTQGIDDAFYRQTGCRPHVIISQLSRKKLDPNREVQEAAQHPEAETAYYEFHAFIEEARQVVENTMGRGLYIDVHVSNMKHPRCYHHV
jgi:hypothetical protein